MKKKFETIKNYYEENMSPGQPEYRILGWESEEAQFSRFETFLSAVDVRNKKILDVGCGTGSLLDCINKKGYKVSYTGLDILECMIVMAKEKGLDGEFFCIDIFKDNPFLKDSFDVVYTSGIFNLNLGNNIEFFKEAIKLFVKLSRETVAFSLLHHHSPGREDRYFYFDPQEAVKIIEETTEEIKSVEVLEDYLQNDFTVICRK